MARNNKTQPSQSAQTLRVIGGDLRGSHLQYHGDPVTRPMKERVREATFNLLGPQIKGTLAIDLFAGTGALAIEAISRGASSAVMIERHFPTIRLIKQNIAHLSLEDRTEVVTGDTLFWCLNDQQFRQLPFTDRLDLPWAVFCSPPYQLYQDQPEQMVQLLEVLIGQAPSGSLFAVEADDRFDPASLPPVIEWDSRVYSPAHLHIGEVK